MKRKLLLMSILLAGTLYSFGQDYDDDIHYNPKKDNTEKKSSDYNRKKKGSSYIANFEDMDVDTYNRRGQYYLSPVDTIGAAAENGEDFVYTQQIQKYYNPTIVIDNADILADVLENSYGNVNIEVDMNGMPYFGPYYNSWTYASPYYSAYWGPSWSWNWGFGNWGWSIGWSNPWYWDAWGPAWGWGPSYGWTWGSGWYPGWNWGWNGYNQHWVANHYRPGGNRRVGAGSNWAYNTRPGTVINGNHNTRPYRGIQSSTGGYSVSGNHRTGGVATYNRNSGSTHRNSSTLGTFNNRNIGTIGTGNNRGGYRQGTSGGNSRTGSTGGFNRNSNYNSTRNSGNNRTTNSGNSSYRSTYNSGSNSGRSGGGSYNTGGNHRSGGSGSFGGGSRGGFGGGGGRSGGHR